MGNPNGPERRKNFLERNDFENDHDLLIKIKTNFSNLVDILDTQKSEREIEHNDHEKRIRTLEKTMFIGMGGLFVLQLFLKFFIK